MTSVTFGEWKEVRAYRFHVLLMKEHDSGFSIIAINLPGVASMGDTEAEAIAHFREAAAAVLESYLDSGEAIPWKPDAEVGDLPFGVRRSVVVPAPSAKERL